MAPPRIVCAAIGGGEAGAGKLLAARFALLREEVRAQTIDEIAQSGLLASTLLAFAPKALRRVRRSSLVRFASGGGKAWRSFCQSSRSFR